MVKVKFQTKKYEPLTEAISNKHNRHTTNMANSVTTITAPLTCAKDIDNTKVKLKLTPCDHRRVVLE